MLSVVVPTLNDDKCLEALLHQLTGKGDDIVVSDGGSTDNTLRIALDQHVRLALGCEGRGWQLARGANWARGDWLLFLHADTKLPVNWRDLAKQHMQNHPEQAGYFAFALDANGVRPRLMEKLANARSSFFALPYGDQGLLISRKLYAECGGFPDWPLFEDVALIRNLGRTRMQKIPAKARTSARKFEEHGYLKRVLGNIILLARYRMGADPKKLFDAYQK